jgi:hypothetical protein
MSALDDWTEAVCRTLDLPADVVDRSLVLDLSRDVAHQVARPAAPLTAYLIGLAAGRGGGAIDPAVGRGLAERVTALAAGWPAPGEP